MRMTNTRNVTCNFILFNSQLIHLIVNMPIKIHIKFMININITLYILIYLGVRSMQLPTTLNRRVFNRVGMLLLANSLMRPRRDRLNGLVAKMAARLTQLTARTLICMVNRATNNLRRLIFTNTPMMNRHAFGRITRTMRFIVVARVNRHTVRIIRGMTNIRVTIIRLNNARSISNLINNLFRYKIQIVNRKVTSYLRPLKRINILRRRTMRLI